jgi:hypothetical protein
VSLIRNRALLRKRVTFANVTAFLALFISLSASSYAAIALPANSVGTKQIKKGAVTRAKLAARAVDGSKVVPRSLTGADIRAGSLTGANINVATLGKVPSAATADSATSAATAGAAPIAKVTIVTAFGTNQGGGSNGDISSATAVCPSGTFVVGGGTRLGDEQNQSTNDGYPNGNNAWTSDVFSDGFGSPGFTVYAICAPAAATG